MEQFTEQQLERILRMPESKQLLKLLQTSSGAVLAKAAEAAKAGNYAAVQEILKPTLQTKEAEALAKKLTGQLG